MKSHFFVKLIPPRPTFHLDITPEEAAIMQEHSVYWAELAKQGSVHVYGPVLDLDGVYGIGVLSVESVEEAQMLMAGDRLRR